METVWIKNLEIACGYRRKDAVVENGQIAVVQINGYNATVKRVRYEKDRIILILKVTTLHIIHKFIHKMMKLRLLVKL